MLVFNQSPAMALAGLLALVGSNLSTQANSGETLRFPENPALSPDGSQLYFSWNDDLWTVPSEGGTAARLTGHPANDTQPAISPDGTKLAFISNRTGTDQLYLADLTTPLFKPRQITHHTAGYALEDWFPDGTHLLVSSSQDDHWRQANRFFKVSINPTSEAPLKLFDAYASNGKVSPKGKQIIFNREGYRWWRKGYRGSKSAQIWTFDLIEKTFTKQIQNETESLWPLWNLAGDAFYYVSGESGSFNLWQHQLKAQTSHQLTTFSDDSTVYPTLSRDGSAMVFRHLSDFFLLNLRSGEPAKQIKIQVSPETLTADKQRRTLDSAQEVAFTKDGLEVAFISGGDVWVMDTELREPKQVTATTEEEHSLIFGPDDQSLYFVSKQKGQSDIWRTHRKNPEEYWWLNDEFELEQLTHDPEVEENLQLSPTGDHIAFNRKNGDIWIMHPDGNNSRQIHSSVLSPSFDWSPDGKWLVLADSDADFNRDIWILPIDGTQAPFNLSRHPDNESNPSWSPDGNLIAFTGRRYDQETDIYFVWLQAEQDERSERDRKLDKAIETMKKHRKNKEKKEKEASDSKSDSALERDDSSDETKEESESEDDALDTKIDFENIHERIHRVSIPNTNESRLFWSHDSKKLGFQATIDGKRGTYTISIPDDLKPKLLSNTTGSQAMWIKRDEQILWLANGKPGRVTKSGKSEPFDFQAKQTISRSKRYRAAFDEAWRLMRDHYYDPNLGNNNWQAVRRKYAPLAQQAINDAQLSTVIQLMLGELNGSHLGFYPANSKKWKPENEWNTVTAHLGLRFDPDFKGPGIKVRDRLPTGPSDRSNARIEPGEIVLRIDQTPVDSKMDLVPVLNGPIDRSIVLRVADRDGEERDVTINPITYSAARTLLYRQWIRDNRQRVDKASDNTLGYLHIRAMNWPSFQQFERDIYAAGVGKEGLIIDVRENGGGFTTDHLLTVVKIPAQRAGHWFGVYKTPGLSPQRGLSDSVVPTGSVIG